MAAADTENWDDDIDFQGDLFTHSVSTVHTNFSSRLSMHSESNAGDEDWHVMLSPNDELSTTKAIQSAKQAGIPIPQNVPSSALMGGTIKRLGKANLRPKATKNNDDWAEDLDIPQTVGLLSLKKPTAPPKAATNGNDDDDDWANDLDVSQPGPLLLKRPDHTSAFKASQADNDDDNDDWANDLNIPKTGALALKRLSPAPTSTFKPADTFDKNNNNDDDDDDWANDLNIPKNAPFSLKKVDASPANMDSEERDDFDNFTDGSLGIRFAGTRRDTRNRSSSASAMSPSIGSVTIESEDDDFRGLELPEGPVDLGALLKKRQAAEALALPDITTEIKLAQPTAKKTAKPAVLSDDNDDFLHGLDIGPGELLDTKKHTLNRNIKHKHSKSSIPTPARTPMTTLTFSDKPATTRIPRPVAGGSGSKPAPSRLEPVFESGATQVTRQRPQPPVSSGATFLRSKRSMPVLRGTYQQNNSRSHAPFLPAGTNTQSHHTTTAAKPPSHAAAYHLRRDSDPYHRSQSPPLRPYSRLSSALVPDTPSRSARRADLAPTALAKEAAAKRTVTKPTKKRNFGDGTELDLFDDLPTSTIKESKFLKQPSSRTAPKSLRNIPSRIDTNHGPTKIPLLDRMQTPAPPQTPRSPAKLFQEQSNTPRYLRDTAASRIARETRLRNAPNPRPRSETSTLLPVTTNWKAQIAARSPHTSPIATRIKGKRATPNFIAPNAAQTGKSMTEKGMVFNPNTLRWEGNENSLAPFDFPQPLQTPTPASHAQATSYMTQPNITHQTPPSPPRPALITPLASDYSNQNIKVVGGMVFDPRRMCWLKLRPGEGGNSPSVTEDEEDPFAGLDDLKDGPSGAQSTTGNPQSKTGGGGGGLASDEWLVGEEFDLGPEFIRRQRDEEAAWRRRCESWFSGAATPRRESSAWRWAIRDIAGQML